jgi:predicted transport protein
MNCVFCQREHSILAETELSFAFLDNFPVSKGHTLVIPKRHVATIWDLTQDEYGDVFSLVRQVKDLIQERFAPQGFNIGVNCGEAAGQTVFHAHSRYDDHAVKQMQRNIELIRYRRFGGDLLMLDLLTATSVKGAPVASGSPGEGGGTSSGVYKTISAVMEELDSDMVDRFEALRASLMALGDDVQETTLKFYVAFKRIKNFACVEFRPTTEKILVYVKVDPESVQLEPGFTRDVSNVGHYGTGDLEISLGKPEDLERAMPLIKRSYEES